MKCHMYEPEQIIRSVLLGEKVTAECGESKVLTREDVEAAGGDAPCKACLRAANQTHDEYTIQSPRGWTVLLERWAKSNLEQRRSSGPFTYTVNFSNPKSWHRYVDGPSDV